MTEKAYIYNKELDETFFLVANEDDVTIYNYRDQDVTDQMWDWYQSLTMIPWEPFGPEEDYYKDIQEDR